MDDPSGQERPEEIEASLSITGHPWHTDTHTKKHKWRHTTKEITYIQAYILCGSTVGGSACCQDLALYSWYWLTDSSPLGDARLIRAEAVAPLLQSLDKLFITIMNEPLEHVEEKQGFVWFSAKNCYNKTIIEMAHQQSCRAHNSACDRDVCYVFWHILAY